MIDKRLTFRFLGLTNKTSMSKEKKTPKKVKKKKKRSKFGFHTKVFKGRARKYALSFEAFNPEYRNVIKD